MELLLVAVGLQAFALLALLVVLSEAPGVRLQLRARRDGRTETSTDQRDEQLRHRLVPLLLALFLGAAAAAVVGVGRL